jgi:N-acyl-D-aspartate/D-glutamate deacylase
VVEDIGIKGDRITAVGKKLAGTAVRTIDATGMVVTPGFIDCHNHTDLPILMAMVATGDTNDRSMLTTFWREDRNYASQGVTTMVTGLCGGGMPGTRQWLGLLNAEGFGANVYHLVPYGILRYKLFGDDQKTELSAAQLDTLKAWVAREMEQGALGVSVGLEYAPDCFTTTGELVEIAKVVRENGGIFDAHIRDQTGIAGKNGRPGELNAIEEAIEIGKRSGVPVHISHIQLNLPSSGVTAEQMAGLIEQARAGGLDITADQHPYDAGYAILSYRLPAEFKTGQGINPRYKTPEGKARMQQATREIYTYLGPERISLTSGPEQYRNRTVAEIAEAEGKDPVQAYVDLCCLEPAPFALFKEINDTVNRALMGRPWVFTASDGFALFEPGQSPHPRFFGCFPRKLKTCALDQNLLTLQAAIRSMTSLPARKFNLAGRGEIKPGYYADIAVINLDSLRENATYAERSLFSDGVAYLVVNGVVSIDQGAFTGQRSGRACVMERAKH